jgi:hypothetical protein
MVAPAICGECQAGRHESCVVTWGTPPEGAAGGFACLCQHGVGDESWRWLLADALATRIRFGCEQCYGHDPYAAWEATKTLERTHVLVDDSHFIVQLLRCRACDQDYLWVSTEVVDWSGGDDAQHRQVVPITAAETAELASGGEPDPAALAAFADGRRYLRSDWPTGRESPKISWVAGWFHFVPPQP